jgi:predicted permease
MALLRSAFRSLRAHAMFSWLIIMLLALGIGANTAIFSVVYAVLLKPLPYPQPGDLVMARKPPRDPAVNLPDGGDMMPDNEFLGWLEAVPKSFRSLAAYRSNPATLQLGGGAVRVPSAAVTGEFFPMLGVSAWRGRLFDATDLKPGAPMVAVLSYPAWQSRFNGDDKALGQVVKIDDVAHTIVGVLPPAFEFTDPVQFWRPLQVAPNAPGQLRIQMVRVFGRMLPGTELATAQRELDGISERFWSNLAASFTRPGPGGGDERVVRSPGLQPASGGGERRIVTGPGPEGAPAGERRFVRGPDGGAQANVGSALSSRQSPTPADVAGSRIERIGPPTSGGPAAAAQPGGGPGGEQRIVRRPEGAGPGGGPLRLPFADAKVQLVTLQEQLVKQSRTTLWLLLGAVGFVLLIACANIANLQLARAAGRKRDAAVRAALGASPARLAAELLAENLLLSFAGGLLGVLLAWWGTQALQAWLADYLPRINPVSISSSVLGFAVLLAVVAGLGFGLAPAWQGSRTDLLETLKEGGHQSSPAGHRWRQTLVALEVALALVLAVNTGLLVKSIYQLYSNELGYRTSDVLTANLSLPRRFGTTAQQSDFAGRWLAALQALPGVKTVALTDSPPLSQYTQIVLSSTVQGSTGNTNASVNSTPQSMAVASASPDYFRATGIALRDGRFFSDQDGTEAPKVTIVNESFVKQYYPNGLTLGARINAPSPGDTHGSPATAAIVGVVADIRPRGFESTAQPLAYFPLAQQPRARISAVLQFEGDAATLARAVTTATHKIAADLALDNPTTLEQQIARQTAPRRVTLMLTGAFAATALVLAALGIFGVMSYTVTQRTKEIGVRMALGADAANILRWMMGYGGLAVGAGLAAGLALTFATSRLLTSLLTGVTALDPAVLVAAVLLLALTGLIACLLPARRATRVNPVDALRNE